MFFVVSLFDFVDLVEKVGLVVVNIWIIVNVLMSGLCGMFLFGFDNGDMLEFFWCFFGILLLQVFGNGSNLKNVLVLDNLFDIEQNCGVGLGFIVLVDGYVMINVYVVDDVDIIYVMLIDKCEFKVKLIGVDDCMDVVVVKIQVLNLLVVVIGDLNKVCVGEWVVVIGLLFGFDNMVMVGIVSLKSCNMGDYLLFIQIDVVVNFGNLGGLLINMQGEVIGINLQIYSCIGGFMGILFVILIDEVMCVVDQLKVIGKVMCGWIVVVIGEVMKDVVDLIGLLKVEGVFVSSVELGGLVDKVGIQLGDIILKFNGCLVDVVLDLLCMVGDMKFGMKVMVSVWCKGQVCDLLIMIVEMLVELMVKVEQCKNVLQKLCQINLFGLMVSDLMVEQMKMLKLKNGVQIDGVDGLVVWVGLQCGDIVLCVGDIDIMSVKQFVDVIVQFDLQKVVVVFVWCGDNMQFVFVWLCQK